jgi:hypothetical protein
MGTRRERAGGGGLPPRRRLPDGLDDPLAGVVYVLRARKRRRNATP